MPFIPNTPESLLGRSDSKNPETTCRGITGSGRPCRRPLASSTASSPAVSPGHGRGKGRPSQLRVDDPSNPDLYCWQHRDQASSSAKSSPGPRLSQTPILESRASLDTLMDRLGIVEAQQKQNKKAKGRRPDGTPTRPQATSTAGTPVMGYGASSPSARPPPPSRKTKKKQSTFCCCFSFPVFEEEPPVRPKPIPLQSAPAKLPAGRRTSGQHLAPPSGRPSMASSSRRRSSAQSAMSQTSQYLSLIPPSATPQTASQLMAELAKPVSQQDEAGYIYIFWLTPESQPSTPPAEAAKSLLSPPATREAGKRRASDVLDAFAANASKGYSAAAAAKGGGSNNNKNKTILLKIGRASNVQRRLNEWTRQCGYNLSLIRYYPYIPTNRPSTPRKVPHSHKVERLVHIELAGAGLRVGDRENCDACGKAHREWFEVEASRQSIMTVDENVRRWADWDEMNE
ncbi:meiotically up-regulated gene 113-domain-containing protein [Microdochium trichocladiopsis]|uniref:Meiotically up-regulated gene 113-domain-containing protein n=1 Tax=Microdochium trichocladiopsis TaxID=1682393 RepID=A0A9P8Y8J8_9PEZI|nr:meiotically up-regulated gene 113-domain-containing protein [Microdochium trichocladiopsis]KAH7032765.1 meiotically up-regulated gene 113-domain-containing protein [Microdochium trichocladiopsis]